MKNKKILLLFIGVIGLFVLSGCAGNMEEPITNESFFLIRGLAWVFDFFAGLVNNNFGIAIIITTILIRGAAWPVYAKTNDFSMKMTMMQPEMDKVKEKYVTKKDPESQQKMQMEMMGIYKKFGMNPIGCILMQAIQMTIFITMYNVVRRITLPGGLYPDLDQKFWFWDLSEGGSFTFKGLILAVLVGATMFATQLISQRKPKYIKKSHSKLDTTAQQTQKTMKIVMYMMVVMMASVAFSNNALGLYWVVGNIFTLGQILIGKKMNEKKYNKMNGIIKG